MFISVSIFLYRILKFEREPVLKSTRRDRSIFHRILTIEILLSAKYSQKYNLNNLKTVTYIGTYNDYVFPRTGNG